jgi:hypothetical protein
MVGRNDPECLECNISRVLIQERGKQKTVCILLLAWLAEPQTG